MAKITPIDVIKGISGKYGNGSNDYFATNKSSNKIRLAKFLHPYEGPATTAQLEQQQKFKAGRAVVTSWLNANKPGGANGSKGTEAYQYAQKLKHMYHLSLVTQVLYKYMNDNNEIVLPESANDDTPAGGSNEGNEGNGGGNTPSGNVTLTITAQGGGKVQIGDESPSSRTYKAVAPGTQLTIKATANPGYGFDRWSDGQGGATRTITVNANTSLTATFISADDGE